MKKVVGVNFKDAGKLYYFDPGNLRLKKGMHVIVDTAIGDEYAEVVIENKEINRRQENYFYFEKSYKSYNSR